MEAGVEHLSRATTRHVGAYLAVAEPYYRSMETARRICELARELEIPVVRLIANKVRDSQDEDALRAFAERNGLAIATTVPYDETVVRADRVGGAFIEEATADSPALRALGDLADALVEGRV